MTDNIRFYPIHYTLSDVQKQFFTYITGNEELQKRLYDSSTLAQVALIASEYGFEVTPEDILRAQAGRVLAMINENLIDDVTVLINGGKPASGAQWGRGGNGYLERAGYWLMALPDALEGVDDSSSVVLLKAIKSDANLKEQVAQASTFSDVVRVLQHHGYVVDAIALLAFQCLRILKVDDDLALTMAS